MTRTASFRPNQSTIRRNRPADRCRPATPGGRPADHRGRGHSRDCHRRRCDSADAVADMDDSESD